jgi:hypothetical protein
MRAYKLIVSQRQTWCLGCSWRRFGKRPEKMLSPMELFPSKIMTAILIYVDFY